ncbi:PLP-dependent aminotransferase family protein [Streptomyces sp. 7-21]|jgi:(S)-3,5-dihydroxyphenylglycine transaminase|uniref:aminotransferase-like domain-containing protein n=1 Tax=Streptomyces sp. 7-21 TaxID=2802283 RepID=UPI00191C9809|nr:PLP-dependent aminotransferase family protein [Streptomyces sp. 7-21]MBL1069003.1 PLP-dependent aminotransferase family protein [Streptomyces sp. 7-21]
MAELALSELHASVADPLLDTMNFLNEVTGRYPEAVSLAPGRPYEGFFRPDRVPEYLDAYLGHLRASGMSEAGVSAVLFQYGRTKGIIHGIVAECLANDESIKVSPEALVMTVGAQEGMLLTLRALCAGPGDAVLAASPCYVGITGAARLLDVPVVPVSEGPDGLEPGAVTAAAARAARDGLRPRALYVVPDFANPSGASMPVAARQELLAAAADAGLLIIEDNPYGFFTREAEPRPTLKSLDQDHTVVYLGSFAKTCFPGARLGYVIADQPVRHADGRRGLLADELAKIKSMVTVNTPSLSQAVIGGMLLRSDLRLREANARAIAFYRDNLRTVLAALDHHFPAGRRERLGLSWNTPDGGFFTVINVPFTADAAALERSARRYGVLWTPMAAFYPEGGGEHQLRVSSSYLTRERLEEGLDRLAAFLSDEAASALGPAR